MIGRLKMKFDKIHVTLKVVTYDKAENVDMQSNNRTIMDNVSFAAAFLFSIR